MGRGHNVSFEGGEGAGSWFVEKRGGEGGNTQVPGLFKISSFKL